MWRANDEINKDRTMRVFDNHDEIIVYDTETTGLTDDCKIIQLSAIKYKITNGCLGEEISRFNTYINPKEKLIPKITEITGITDEMLSSAPTEEEIFPEIHRFFGNSPCLAGYNNIKFDNPKFANLYKRQHQYLDIESESAQIDVLDMARELIESPKHNLASIAKICKADDGITFHNSMDDTIVTARLLDIFVKKYQTMPKQNKTRIMPKTCNVWFWKGYSHTQERIFVRTEFGDVYYLFEKKAWNAKDTTLLDKIDMPALEKKILDRYKCSDMSECAKLIRQQYIEKIQQKKMSLGI